MRDPGRDAAVRKRVSRLRPDEIEATLAAGAGGDETKRLRWRVLRAACAGERGAGTRPTLRRE
jgi:hypothetical protein